MAADAEDGTDVAKQVAVVHNTWAQWLSRASLSGMRSSPHKGRLVALLYLALRPPFFRPESAELRPYNSEHLHFWIYLVGTLNPFGPNLYLLVL